MTHSPLDVLRDTFDAVSPPDEEMTFDARVKNRREHQAALAAVEQLVQAARGQLLWLDATLPDTGNEPLTTRNALRAALAVFDRKEPS